MEHGELFIVYYILVSIELNIILFPFTQTEETKENVMPGQRAQ